MVFGDDKNCLVHTAFYNSIGDLSVIPILGVQVPDYLPTILILLCVMSFFDFYARALRALGYHVFMYSNNTSRDKYVKSGENYLKSLKKKYINDKEKAKQGDKSLFSQDKAHWRHGSVSQVLDANNFDLAKFLGEDLFDMEGILEGKMVQSYLQDAGRLILNQSHHEPYGSQGGVKENEMGGLAFRSMFDTNFTPSSLTSVAGNYDFPPKRDSSYGSDVLEVPGLEGGGQGRKGLNESTVIKGGLEKSNCNEVLGYIEVLGYSGGQDYSRGLRLSLD
jgi:hypothetical protein